MSLPTRAQVVIYLTNRLQHIAAEVNQATLDDTATGWGPDIDLATARIGSGTNGLAFYVLSEYFALARFAALLATRVDTEGYAVEGNRERIFDNVVALRDMVASQCAMYGYSVVSDAAGSVPDADSGVAQSGLTIDQLRLHQFYGDAGGTEYTS